MGALIVAAVPAWLPGAAQAHMTKGCILAMIQHQLAIAALVATKQTQLDHRIPKSDDHEALNNATKLAYKMRRACLEEGDRRTNRC